MRLNQLSNIRDELSVQSILYEIAKQLEKINDSLQKLITLKQAETSEKVKI